VTEGTGIQPVGGIGWQHRAKAAAFKGGGVERCSNHNQNQGNEQQDDGERP